MIRYEDSIIMDELYTELINFCDRYLWCIEQVYIAVKSKLQNYSQTVPISSIPDAESKATDVIFEILRKNGTLNEFYKQNLFCRLLSDFLLYMQESISNVKRLNPQVSLTLARKPLIDDVYYAYLETEATSERRPGTEWFHLDGNTSLQYFNRFAWRMGIDPAKEHASYELRSEQRQAVEKTKAYFEGGGKEFLWNAKPRFGKTLSAYDLIRTMGFMKVLIVTNRPSISNSWADDFRKFIGWQTNLKFVSDNDALTGKPGVMTRDEYVSSILTQEEGNESGMVAFESLQGLKGSVYFGGLYDKLKWIKDFEFDLLIVDESQEGVDTVRTDRAFDNITRKHTLYLSGTPFKQLANISSISKEIWLIALSARYRQRRKVSIKRTNQIDAGILDFPRIFSQIKRNIFQLVRRVKQLLWTQ